MQASKPANNGVAQPGHPSNLDNESASGSTSRPITHGYDPHMDAYEVQEQPQESGVLRSARLRWTAHWTERATEAEIRILDSQIRLAEQKKHLAEAQLESRRRVAQAARFAEDEEGERQLRQRIRGMDTEQARQLIEKEMEIGAMLLEREVLRFQRQTVPFGGGWEPNAPRLLPARPSTGGSLEVHVSDEQIEALALQALARLGQMDPRDADAAWEDWRTELIRRLPAYAAAEVIRRAERLRTLAR